jgi:transcription initiation factor TFIID subunit 11
LSVITGNQSAAPSTTGGPKKRGRKKKADTQSVRSGKAGPSDAVSQKEAADDDGEDDDDADEEDMVDEGAKIDQIAENKKIAVLLDAFNTEQSERYNTYRRAKLKKETLRKITNQTLSQSVPPSVVTTINGFTKVFIGTLIERARDVQRENAMSDRSMSTRLASSGQLTQSSSRTAADSSQGIVPMTQDRPSSSQDDFSYLGPLLPDDIREAYRRYRRNGEGGSAGSSGISVGLGVPGSGAARIREKRMFR